MCSRSPLPCRTALRARGAWRRSARCSGRSWTRCGRGWRSCRSESLPGLADARLPRQGEVLDFQGEVWIVRGVVEENIAPTLAQSFLFRAKASFLFGRVLVAARLRFMVHDSGKRRPQVAQPESLDAQAEIHVVESHRERFVEPADLSPGLTADHHACASDRGYVL